MPHTDNIYKGFEEYKEALKNGMPLNTAISLAGKYCSLPAELDMLQQLINREYIVDTYKQLIQAAQACINDLELSLNNNN